MLEIVRSVVMESSSGPTCAARRSVRDDKLGIGNDWELGIGANASVSVSTMRFTRCCGTASPASARLDQIREHTMRPIVLTAAFVVAFAGASYASDGVVEINQARALAGGVTRGDAPGFPVTISQPGSYRLTG